MLIYPIFFFIRRLILSASVIYTSTHLIVQIYGFAGMTTAMIILVGHVKPFKLQKRNKVEILNEVCILLIMYQTFCFSDFLPSPRIKFYIGYFFSFIIVAHFLTTLVTQFQSSFKIIKRRMKLKRALKKQKKKLYHRINTRTGSSNLGKGFVKR